MGANFYYFCELTGVRGDGGRGWLRHRSNPNEFPTGASRRCMLLNLRYLNCLAYRGRPNLLKGFLFSVATLGHMRTRLLFCSLPPSQCPFRHFDSPVLNLVSL